MGRLNASRSFLRNFRRLNKLTSHQNESIAVLAVNTIGAWGAAGPDEIAALKDQSTSPAVKHALAVALATTLPRYAKTLRELVDQGDQLDLATRYAAVAGLANVDLDHSAKAAAKLLPEDPETIDPVPLVVSFLKQPQGAKLLAQAIQETEVHSKVLLSVSNFNRVSGVLPDALAKIFRGPTASSSLTAD